MRRVWAEMLDDINKILTTIRFGGQVRTFINPPTWLPAKYFQQKCNILQLQNIFKLKLLSLLVIHQWQSQANDTNM